MARTDTLGNFLTDVADAIRTKKGTTDTIPASEFDNEIANLPSSGEESPLVTLSNYDEEGYPTKAVIHKEVPNSLFEISTRATPYLSKIKEITIDEGVTTLGTYSLYNMQQLVDLTLPSTLTSIGRYCFFRNYVLNNITLPEGLIEISSYFLTQCNAITEIVIPSSVTKIDNYFVYNATGVKKVTVKCDCNIFSQSSFYNCSSLDTLIFEGATKVYTRGDSVLNNTPIANGAGYIYVPDNLVDAYRTNSSWIDLADQFKSLNELEASE